MVAQESSKHNHHEYLPSFLFQADFPLSLLWISLTQPVVNRTIPDLNMSMPC